MPVSDDTEEQLIADAADLIRRAIVFGRKLGSDETAQRILHAASVVAAPQPGKAALVGLAPTVTVAQKEPPKKPRQRKYEYGYVTGTIRKVLKQNPNGLEFGDVATIANHSADPVIDTESIRSALKQMVSRKDARYENSRYFPPSKENGAS